MRSGRHSQHRFTCIDIMLPILVVGLLTTIVIQSVRGLRLERAKRTKAEADIAELQTALDHYYLDNGFYPSTDQGLRALVTEPATGTAPIVPLVYCTGGYIEWVPRDPWGNPYFYQSDGNSYVLKSLGPDGIESADDIDGSQSSSGISDLASPHVGRGRHASSRGG